MLIEDEDGAPLPGEFQRSGHLWDVVYSVTRKATQTDELMRRLAPIFATPDGYTYNEDTRRLEPTPETRTLGTAKRWM